MAEEEEAMAAVVTLEEVEVCLYCLFTFYSAVCLLFTQLFVYFYQMLVNIVYLHCLFTF